MKLLAIDAGKSNFAYAALEHKADDVTITNMGLLANPITDLSREGFKSNVQRFDAEIQAVLKGTDLVVFERVIQQPGRTSGSAVEYIGFAMGIVTARCEDMGILAIPTTAATWKRATRRVAGNWEKSAELFGQKIKSKASKANVISDHEYDALGIALWFLVKQNVMTFVDAQSKMKNDVIQHIKARQDVV